MTAVINHIARGRELVQLGQTSPTSMLDNLALIAYWQEQREIVARRGQCAARCNCDQATHLHGHPVCPHTWQPCPLRQMSLLVELFSKVNA